MNATFSKIFKNLRLDNCLSQGDLAEEFKVSGTTIHKWETGKAEPNIEMLKQIAAFFRKDLDELLYGTTNNKIMKTNVSEIELLFDQLSREQQNRVLGIIQGILLQDGKNINEILGNLPKNRF